MAAKMRSLTACIRFPSLRDTDITQPEASMPWIDHPATQNGPVSLWRWIKYHVADWMLRKGNRWEREALYPHDDDIPF